jgi:hypothetical protein
MTYPGSIHDARIACIQCGYNLSGVPLGGTCPECGVLVSQSVRPPVTQAQAQGSSGTAITCLVLGILSLVACQLLGPVAVMLYSSARGQVERGEAPESSLGLAKAGMITGWIGTAILIAYIGILAIGIVGSSI